jgi:hypothetical protein
MTGIPHLAAQLRHCILAHVPPGMEPTYIARRAFMFDNGSARE